MGVVVVVVSKNYLLNDHTRTNIFNIHNNHYIIVQGVGGIKGVGSHSSYRISLYAFALACSWILFAYWTLSAWINAGTVDTHSPILPVNLMKFSENIRLFPALTENIWIYLKLSGINWTHLKTSEIIWNYLKLSGTVWKHLKISEFIWNYFDDFLKLSEIIRHCLKKLDNVKN